MVVGLERGCSFGAVGGCSRCAVPVCHLSAMLELVRPIQSPLGAQVGASHSLIAGCERVVMKVGFRVSMDIWVPSACLFVLPP